MSNLYFHAKNSAVEGAKSGKQDHIESVFRQRRSMAIESLESRCMLATIYGQLWNDADGNEKRGPGESGLNGIAIELFDPTGALIAATTTATLDVIGDIAADQEAELGSYQFTGLAPGTYVVRPRPTDRWQVTTIDPLAETSVTLNNLFGFYIDAGYNEDWAQENEKWLQSSKSESRWYYILPTGELYQWDTISGIRYGRPLDGRLITTLDTTFWRWPSLLHEAPQDDCSFVTLDEKARADFGVRQLSVIADDNVKTDEAFPAPTNLGLDEELGANIQRTMRLLATSTTEKPNTVRILFYGQSIIKQDWWLTVVDDLRRRFPHANLIVENRAIGGFASHLLAKTAETDLYSFYPDLLIFHVYGTADYENILRRIRERTTAEILILTDHVTKDEQRYEESDPDNLSPNEDLEAWTNYWFLPWMARKYQTGLVDVRALWKQYLTDHGLSASQLLRDAIHLNEHGEYLLAELVMAHLRYRDGQEPDADQWVKTYEIGTDVDWTEDGLTLDFTGNRIDVVFEGYEDIDLAFSIDGQQPSEIPGLYGRTPTTYYPETNWPSLLKVGNQSPLVLERWTATLTDISAGQTQFSFEVYGSGTGYDGQGHSDQPFVSDSGRVVIDPSDWNLVYSLWASNNPIDEGFEIVWDVVPYYVDDLATPPDYLVRGDAITIAQGLPPGDHQLELEPGAKRKVKQIRVYEPPRLNADRTAHDSHTGMRG